MRFKKNFKSNLIQIINDFNVANKYDLIWQTHFILKCLNRNIINEEIIITLETFSSVAMWKFIRILLAINAYYDYEIWQMDVKTTFLNGNLLEDV